MMLVNKIFIVFLFIITSFVSADVSADEYYTVFQCAGLSEDQCNVSGDECLWDYVNNNNRCYKHYNPESCSGVNTNNIKKCKQANIPCVLSPEDECKPCTPGQYIDGYDENNTQNADKTCKQCPDAYPSSDYYPGGINECYKLCDGFKYYYGGDQKPPCSCYEETHNFSYNNHQYTQTTSPKCPDFNGAYGEEGWCVQRSGTLISNYANYYCYPKCDNGEYININAQDNSRTCEKCPAGFTTQAEYPSTTDYGTPYTFWQILIGVGECVTSAERCSVCKQNNPSDSHITSCELSELRYDDDCSWTDDPECWKNCYYSYNCASGYHGNDSVYSPYNGYDYVDDQSPSCTINEYTLQILDMTSNCQGESCSINISSIPDTYKSGYTVNTEPKVMIGQNTCSNNTLSLSDNNTLAFTMNSSCMSYLSNNGTVTITDAFVKCPIGKYCKDLQENNCPKHTTTDGKKGKDSIDDCAYFEEQTEFQDKNSEIYKLPDKIIKISRKIIDKYFHSNN